MAHRPAAPAGTGRPPGDGVVCERGTRHAPVPDAGGTATNSRGTATSRRLRATFDSGLARPTVLYILPEDEANSNLYYLLDCLPPRPWAFTAYPWYSRNGLAQRWLAAFKTLKPRYVVYYPRRWQVETHNAALVQDALDHYDRRAPLSSSEGEAWLLVWRGADE